MGELVAGISVALWVGIVAVTDTRKVGVNPVGTGGGVGDGHDPNWQDVTRRIIGTTKRHPGLLMLPPGVCFNFIGRSQVLPVRFEMHWHVIHFHLTTRKLSAVPDSIDDCLEII